MKTAIYIEDGVQQVVLTPESEFEKAALFAFVGKEMKAEAFKGAFYDCRGGWVRQSRHFPASYDDEPPTSLILKADATDTQA